MSIMFKIPSVARDWTAIQDDELGRKFHRDHGQEIAKFRDRHSLEFHWNIASGTSHHPRFQSIVSGFSQSFEDRERETVHELRLNFQELDPSRFQNVIMMTLSFLRAQERILYSLRDGLPEADDPILLDVRLPKFKDETDRLWSSFANRFPNDVKNWTSKVNGNP